MTDCDAESECADETADGHESDDGFFRRPHSTPRWLRKLAGLVED